MNTPKPRLPTKDFSVPEEDTEAPNQIYYQMAGKKRRAHATWHRGEHTNFHPVRESLAEKDAVARYVGHGWFPPAPFITREHHITAFGSCFAAEVTKFLISRRYPAKGIVVTEFGPVPVSWKRGDTQLEFEFQVPVGIAATLQLPSLAGQAKLISGQQIRTVACC